MGVIYQALPYSNRCQQVQYQQKRRLSLLDAENTQPSFYYATLLKGGSQ